LTLQRLDLSAQPRLGQMQRLGAQPKCRCSSSVTNARSLVRSSSPITSTVFHAGSSTPVNDEQLSSSS
jgi:hypothetical protein